MKLTKTRLKQIIKEELSIEAEKQAEHSDSHKTIPEGSKVYPDIESMAIQYETPDGDMKILNVFGDEYDDNWLGGTDKLLELTSRNDLKFMLKKKQLDGKKWLYTIVLDWLRQWGPTDDEEDDDRMIVMTEETEDDLLDLLDKLTDYKG